MIHEHFLNGATSLDPYGLRAIVGGLSVLFRAHLLHNTVEPPEGALLKKSTKSLCPSGDSVCRLKFGNSHFLFCLNYFAFMFKPK